MWKAQIGLVATLNLGGWFGGFSPPFGFQFCPSFGLKYISLLYNVNEICMV